MKYPLSFTFRFCRLSFLIWMSALLFIANAQALGPIDVADFEGVNLPDWITGGSAVAVVTQNPSSGSFSLRGNLNPGVTPDPLTGFPGSGLQSRLEIQHPYMVTATDKIFISFDFRLDDCKWDGSAFGSDSDADPYVVDMKLMYLRKGFDPSDSFFVGLSGSATGNMTLAANNSLWQQASFDLWGGYVTYYKPPVYLAADGVWNSVGVYVDYSNPNPKLSIMVNNEFLRFGEANDTSRILPTDWRLDSIQMPYTGSSQVNLSSNRTGYCNGWQIDNIKVWTNIPSGPLSPSDVRSGE